MIQKIKQLPRGIRWFVAAHVAAVALISVASWWVGEHLAERPTEMAAPVTPVPPATHAAATPSGAHAQARSAAAVHDLPADHHDAPRLWSYDTQGRVVMAQPDPSVYR